MRKLNDRTELPKSSLRRFIQAATLAICTVALQSILLPLPYAGSYLLLYPAVFWLARRTSFYPTLFGIGVMLCASHFGIFSTRSPASFTEPTALVSDLLFVILASAMGWLVSDGRKNERSLSRSEQWFHVVLKSIGDAVLVTDRQGRIIFLNPVAEKLTGWTRKEAWLRSAGEVLRLINGETRERIQDPVARVLEKRVNAKLPCNTLLVSRDGRERPVEDSAALIRMPDAPDDSGVVLVFRDATAKRRAQQHLLESEMLFRRVADEAPVLIWSSGPDKRCDWFNVGWLDFTGRSLEQEIGNGWIQGVHPEDVEHCIRVYTESFDARRPFSMEYRLRRSDGTYRWLVDRGAPRFSLGGEFLGFIGACADVQEHHDAISALHESNTKYKIVSRATRDTIWDWNLLTEEVEWNEAVITELGYSSIERHTHSQWWYNHIHPGDRERVEKGIRYVLESGKEFWADEYRFIKHDGSLAHVLDRGFVIHGPDGRPVRMIGVMQDTTDRVSATAKLQELQSRFDQVARAIDVGVWYCDLPFAELIWSDTVKQHFFMAKDATITMEDFYSRIHADDRHMVRAAIEESIGNHVLYEVEFRTLNPADPREQKWIRALGKTVYNKNGAALRFDGITLDVSEHKRASEERDQALLAANEALRTRDEFMSIASHELKTPLTSLHLQLQLLSKAAEKVRSSPQVSGRYSKLLEPNRLNTTLSSCVRQSGRLTSLLEELLDLTRVRLGKLQLAREKFDLSNLTKEVLGRFAQDIEQKRYSVICEIPDQVVGYWDPTRIEQVITNLVSNALKYGEGEPIRIRVAFDETLQKAILQIEDSGMGIALDLQSKIFERFERGVSGQVVSGLGLGLYITRQIVEAHGGQIRVSSSPGEGALFTVELPALSIETSGSSPRICLEAEETEVLGNFLR